ncbi:MAG: hypothetical protein H6737_17345 [Alphaproteobacteria bacterium]|nr:hypothetical protein [Alphaproteobacteria bacterium]
MDIWAWVQAARKGLPEEESALARRLAYLPSWVNDQDHARVDAAVPEMLADVRRLGLPWLEVFVRHWRLQSLVFHRQEIAASLPEAVALLERAHRDDAKDCPQTVCVAQDVCASYGYADGPGYGEQRIAVSEETLARIDASWPCFHCISSERISALNDLGRHEEALEAVETALSAMRDAGHVIETGDFAWSRSEALRELGRVDEALRVAQRAESSAKGRSFEREKVLHVVTYQALLDRIDEATAALPEWEAVSDTASLFEDWCEAVYLLARRGAEGVGLRQLPSFAIAARQLLDQGCPRDAFRIACWGAEIAGGFGRLEVGRAFLDVAGRARRGLVKDLGADEQLGHATRAVDAVEAPVLPDSWEAFDAESSANGVSFDAAVAAVRRWPDQLGFALNVARHWRAQGFPQASRAVTEALLAANPDSADAWLGVGEAMRDEGDWEGLAGLLEQAPETADLHVHWLRSFLLEQRGDRPGAIAALDALLDTGRAGVGAALRKAAICRAMERWSDVIASIDVAIAMGMEPGSPDWDRIVAATVLGDWAVVRDGCARLGIELDDDAGPIEEAWGVVRVRYPEDSDHHSWAERTGPVTARVLSIHGPGPERERHADRVIFEPVPLDDDREYPLFRVVRFEDGGFESFALDGENPGEAEIQRLRDELGALGIPTRSTHSTQYLLKDPDTGASHPGCYVRIAVPRARPDLRGVLNTALKRFAAETGARLVWLELLEALGDSALDAQRALAERWGI